MIKDKKLEDTLLAKMYDLEKKIDFIAPTDLRKQLNEMLVNMRAELVNYKQE